MDAKSSLSRRQTKTLMIPREKENERLTHSRSLVVAVRIANYLSLYLSIYLSIDLCDLSMVSMVSISLSTWYLFICGWCLSYSPRLTSPCLAVLACLVPFFCVFCFCVFVFLCLAVHHRSATLRESQSCGPNAKQFRPWAKDLLHFPHHISKWTFPNLGFKIPV